MEAQAKTYMSGDPVYVGPDASALEAFERMWERGIRHLPVCDGERRVVKQAEPMVTVTGPPGELVLFMSGRQDAAAVAIELARFAFGEVAGEAADDVLLHAFVVRAAHDGSFTAPPSPAVPSNADLSSFIARWTRTLTAPTETPSSSPISS